MKNNPILLQAYQHWQNFRPTILKILNGGIVIIAAYFIYTSLRDNEHLDVAFQGLFQKAFHVHNLPYFFILILLLCLNYVFEALKWQKLIHRIESVHFSKAIESVLASLTLGMVFISGFVGVYAGRVWHLQSDKRTEVLGALFVSGGSQGAVTFYWGGIGLIYFLQQQAFITVSMSYALYLGITLLFPTLIWLLTTQLKQLTFLKKLLGYFYKYIAIIQHYTFKEIVWALVYASARFAVFTFQFVIILYLYQVDMPLLSMLSAIVLVFLAKVIMPYSNVLLNLSVRQVSTLYFFGEYGMDSVTAICVTFSLWALNIILPSIIGLLFVFKMKILRENGEGDPPT